MKLIILIIISLFLQNKETLGQSFSHSLGTAILAGEEAVGLGLVYSPRINVIKFHEAITASLGTHIAIAANASDDGAGSTTQNFIGFEFPIMAELNFGKNSHPENESSFGGFIGIGYGISTLSQSDPGEAFAKGLIYNAGLRFRGDWGVRFAYLENFNSNVFGGASITIQWNIN
jgi:hypothetical protein